MPNENGANNYGGKDSWDDYDNSNTVTPGSNRARSQYNRARDLSRSKLLHGIPNPDTGIDMGTDTDSNTERGFGGPRRSR